MIEFTLNMPNWVTPYAVATVRILDSFKPFMTEAILLGYEPPMIEPPENQGITFNTECSKTGDKHAIVLLSREKLDIETIMHEVRHAYFWVMSDRFGTLKVNLLDAKEEESFCERLDILTNRCISTIQSHLGDGLKWKFI